MLIGLEPNIPTGAAVPVPERGIVKVGLAALEVTVTLPLSLAAVAGSKLTLNVAPCPAPRVIGVAMPLTLNPEPLAATCEIVTLELPVFVMVSDVVCLVFTVTLPKLTVVALAPNSPGVTPVPDKVMPSVESEASDAIVTVPEALPEACGVNDTVKVVLCEAFKVSGTLMPLIWNPVPVTAICEMSTAVELGLLRVTVCDCVVPSATLPKASLAGLIVSDPDGAVDPVPVSETLV
jgi:hypothetical protein